jgi:hypothetical protein
MAADLIFPPTTKEIAEVPSSVEVHYQIYSKSNLPSSQLRLE